MVYHMSDEFCLMSCLMSYVILRSYYLTTLVYVLLLRLDLWMSRFKYRFFLGGGFLRYCMDVFPPGNQILFCCNRVFEPQKRNRNDFFSNLLT